MYAPPLRTLLSAFVLPLTVAAAACATDPPKSPAVGLTQAAVTPKFPQPGPGVARPSLDTYRVYLTTGIPRTCTGTYPFFDYDSSKLAPSDQPDMDSLAECMQTGPLAGRRILVVGRTDPRGSDAYNVELGKKRAEKVKGFLVARGVSSDRILVDSIGKAGADPDESAWGTDRRVEIEPAD